MSAPEQVPTTTEDVLSTTLDALHLGYYTEGGWRGWVSRPSSASGLLLETALLVAPGEYGGTYLDVCFREVKVPHVFVLHGLVTLDTVRAWRDQLTAALDGAQ